MPIQLLGGPPRSGKSHYGVKYRLMNFLKKGVTTVTDIDGLNLEEIAKYSKISLEEVRKLVIIVSSEEVKKMLKDESFLYDPKRCPNSFLRPGMHLMLDEAWRYWRAGQKLTEIETEFFPYHGHYNDPITNNAIEITLLTQAKNQLAKELHPLIEAEYRFRKMKITGKSNEFQVWVYDGNNRKATSHYNEKYDPKIFPLYKSASNGDVMDDTDKRRSIYNTPLFKVVLPLAALAAVASIFILIWAMKNLTEPKSINKGNVEKIETRNTPTEKESQKGPTEQNAVKEVSPGKWRILAAYKVNGLPVLLIKDENERIRTITPGSVSTGAGGEIYSPIARESEEATPWAGNSATYTEKVKNK